MDLSDPAQRRAFFDLHSGLPREGPGNRASTARAVALMGTLPTAPRVIDVACGPGKQTLDLAELIPDGHIVAIDAHAPFLAELRRRARAAGIGERIETLTGDMAALPFAPGSIDILWCEGGAYITGLTAALAHWTPLLAAKGRIALTEAVWLKSDVPGEVRDFWRVYPAMTDVASCRGIVRRAGLRLLGDFLLPQAAWWDDYYGPLAARIEQIAPCYENDAAAQVVLDAARREIDRYRRYSDYYGYQFFVMAH